MSPSENLPGTFRTIPDRSAFLWCFKWKKNDLFGDIYFVFDCAVSTKDCTHQKRTGKKFDIVDIPDDNPCPADQELSLLTTVAKRNLFDSWQR